MKRHKPLNFQSNKGKKIEKALYYIREIKRIETGNSCEICGRHQCVLPEKLSILHIISRAKSQRLVLYRPNLLLACWAKGDHQPYCHNLYDKAEKNDPRRQEIIRKMEFKLGISIANYKLKLRQDESVLPRMSDFQIDNYLFIYKEEYERLKKCRK